jgi:hypothetical protein
MHAIAFAVHVGIEFSLDPQTLPHPERRILELGDNLGLPVAKYRARRSSAPAGTDRRDSEGADGDAGDDAPWAPSSDCGGCWHWR